MGFFDRFASKKPSGPATPAPVPSQPAAAEAKPATPAVAGGVMPRLQAARARLDAKDLPAAMAIYEEVFAAAGDRADVLLTASGDLGTHGHVREIIELVAPRYDAQRHGAAAGFNLLQAYIVTRNAEAAQHLLDLLFGLNRPELEQRLLGFSNAITEMMVAEEGSAQMPQEALKISLVSISKPVWFYGLEGLAPQLLPKKDGKLRRVAFAQLATLGEPDLMERAKLPEDTGGRFARGLPLWFAETFHYSDGYDPIAGIGVYSPEHYALFPAEWTAENVRQLNESTSEGLDFVVTGSVRNRNADYELTLRIWEVKKFRELKSFSTRWTPSNVDDVLRQFQEQIRAYMEWTALPAGNGPAYSAPPAPHAHVQSLGASLGLFLAEKQVIAGNHAPASMEVFLRAAQANPDDARTQLTLVSAILRFRAKGMEVDSAALAHARAWLASPSAQAADASALMIKLA